MAKKIRKESEIAHAYRILDPTRITAHIEAPMFNGEIMAGDVSKPIYSAALRLYYDELGKKIEGMSHYYKITFWNGCNGVEVTK